MFKNYTLYSLGIILFYTITACEKPPKLPTTNIQLKIVDTNVSEGEKKRGIVNIQKRLESVGAKNISITEQEDQKITFNYEGNIKPQTFEKAFSVSGKLEFFEVCNDKAVIYQELRKIYASELQKDELLTQTSAEIESMDTVLGISIIDNSNMSIFAVFPEENMAKVTKTVLQKEPFFVSKLKRKIKFLLGKEKDRGNHELYAVYVNAENKAPIDGSYVIDVSVTESNYNDSYLINIKKNEEGAKIWEELTTHVHQTHGNIAVVVDNIVYSAPSVLSGGISGGNSEISSNLNREEAAILAAAIRSGNVPKVEIVKIEVVKETESKK